jgi:hypothetical protein
MRVKSTVQMLVLLSAGCSPAPTAPHELSGIRQPSFYVVGGSTTCGGTGNDALGDGVDGSCLRGKSSIDLNQPANGLAELQQAIGNWNVRLAGVPSMPLLQIVPSGGTTVNIPSGTGQFCGGVNPGTGGVTGALNVYLSSHPDCTTRKTGGLTAVLTHELSHILGWNSGHGGDSAVTSLTENCTTFNVKFGTPAPINESVCLHDVEALFRAHASGSGWSYSYTYFQSPILWTTNAPDNTNIPASSSAQIAMTQFVPLPGTAANRSHTHLTWSESTSLFSVDGSGNVTTGSPLGSAKLFLKATSSPPSGYLIWTPFKDKGDSVTVTVVSAGPFLVDSLIADQQPVIYGGMRTFTMFTSNQPSGSVSSQWWVDDPRTPGVYPDTIFTKSGLQASFLVDADYFGLEIFVRAYVGGVGSGVDSSGFFFPVCGSQDAFAECPEDQ